MLTSMTLGFKGSLLELSKLILCFFKFKLIAALAKAVSHNTNQQRNQLIYAGTIGGEMALETPLYCM